MNLADITTKSYILTMLIRDDGERFLLGDGAFEFKDSQQHFQPNTYANDVVELQGTDGQMLAGQVRRTATQTWNGYIGDATTSKQQVEQYRRSFFLFFRPRHYYTAVYIFCDGSAIQRKRGYIVNAPSVPELWQKFPEWSVGLNFEDPNYYEYAEDDEGNEIYAHAISIALASSISGGLIWDGDGAVSDDLSYVGTEIEGEGKNFQLADTGTATLKSAELLGDAEQTTYSGKNLLPMINTTRTINGVTFTPRADGSIALSGTASAQTNYPINVDSANITRNVQLSAGTYTTSWGSNPASSGMFVQVYYIVDGGSGQYSNGTFTVSGTQATLGAYIRVNNGINTNGTVIYPMLESGSTATAYEPYVGGTASPNPDYPQAVNTVTGEQTVKIEGKNLFNTNLLSASGITIADDVASGTASSFYSAFGSNGIELPHIGQATLQMTGYTDANQSSENTSGLIFRFGYTDGTYSPYTEWKNNDTTPTLKTVISASGKTLDKLYILFGNKGQNIWHLSNIQLEVGSTATDYEPYQGQTKTVNLGKNLFSISQDTIISNAYLENNATLTFDDLNSVSITATGTQGAQYLYRIITGLDSTENYTFSFKGTKNVKGSTGLSYIRITTYGSNDGSTWTNLGVSGENNPTQGTTYSFTKTLTGYTQYRFMVFNNADTPVQVGEKTTYSEMMLEKGTTATTYAPYFTPIELAKIGTYQDYIWNDDGVWKIHKEVGKVVLDGSDDWQISNTGTASFFYFVPNKATGVLPTTGTTCRVLLSNYGSGGVGIGNSGTDNGVMITTTDGGVRIRYGAEMTLTDWKNKVSSMPMIVYYPLATPTDTEITNSELVGQLERLRHSHTYADTTNFSITATSPNLPAFLKVVAFGKDATPQGGYVWEDGGSPRNIITIDGVDSALPIWKVNGPATNPTLTNITTGQTITWTGFVPSGQTLTIDMGEMTASLAGANVFEYVSGEWIELQSGNNLISYTAQGGATDPSTLEWNGVAG